MQKMIRLSLFGRVINHSLIVAAATLASLALLADDQEKAGKDKEISFIKEVANGNLLEIKLGQLASSKAESSEVKQFAERLVADHKKASEELKEIADRRDVTVPTDLDSKYQKKLDKFESQTGSEFDKEFAKHMITDHKKEIAKYEKAAKECKDAELKTFVRKTLPTLREHLRMAQDVGRSVGLDATAIAAALREGEEAAGAASGESEIGKGEKKDDSKQ